MDIALIAPPFIPVPPVRYGGTELYLADLAAGLSALGHHLIVYANGESLVPCEVRSLYPRSEWPLSEARAGAIKSFDHYAWAVRDAAGVADVVHINDALAIPLSRFVDGPVVHTLHHPQEEELSQLYGRYPDLDYVAISASQARRETMPRLTVVHHGIDLNRYMFAERKEPFLAFVGRFAPIKGAHLAVEVARRTGIPLKMAGEIQPAFADYWESEVRPHVDGRLIEYVGEADLAVKNDLLARASALLFPIQWDEPFGLIMVEAMACGTPVLALEGGSVREVVCDGVSGWICADVEELARCAGDLDLPARDCRDYVEVRFSRERMARDYEMLYQRLVSGREDLVGAEAWRPPLRLTGAAGEVPEVPFP